MNHNLLLLLPLLAPLYGAVLCLMLWKRVMWHYAIAGLTQLVWLGATALLLYELVPGGIISTQIGDWPAPFGITLVADLFSALILLASAIIGLAVFIYSIKGLDYERKRYGYYPMLLILQMGVGGVCLTGDIFNLYVWFEVLLICCFALISLGSTQAQLEGALKYVTINMVASGLLLAGIGVVYHLTGTLNLAELGQLVRLPTANAPMLTLASIFFLIGFGIKSAIFPLFFWLPASYPTAPIAISSFVAGLISKVGIYTFIRLFTLVFVTDPGFTLPLLLLLSGLTMVVGVVGAAAQTDFRKILSFHIISQIGYMLMGLAIYTPLAIGGSIFFILHNIFVKTNLFLISGAVARRHGTFALQKLGGVYLQQPFLALLFLVSAFSLAGIPPLSGFWGKFMLARAGLEAGNYAIVAASLAVSVITMLSMTKIWNEVFWKKPTAMTVTVPAESMKEVAAASNFLQASAVFLMVFILVIGLYAEPLIRLVMQAAEQLLEPVLYINTVLHT